MTWYLTLHGSTEEGGACVNTHRQQWRSESRIAVPDTRRERERDLLSLHVPRSSLFIFSYAPIAFSSLMLTSRNAFSASSSLCARQEERVCVCVCVRVWGERWNEVW